MGGGLVGMGMVMLVLLYAHELVVECVAVLAVVVLVVTAGVLETPVIAHCLGFGVCFEEVGWDCVFLY